MKVNKDVYFLLMSNAQYSTTYIKTDNVTLNKPVAIQLLDHWHIQFHTNGLD